MKVRNLSKVLKQPVTIGHLLAIGLTIIVMILAMGAGGQEKTLVARANTLNPTPFPVAPPVAPVVKTEVVPASTPYEAPSPATGPISGGYNIMGPQCTECVAHKQSGNAGTWVPTHSDPRIGDTMIFYPGEQGASAYGHVAQVVGISGNMISVKQCNWRGSQSVFYSTGKFY